MTDEVRVTIRQPIDVFVARWTVQRTAAAAGFGSVAQQELAIVVSELATNILKYGIRGEITIRPIATPRLGVEVVAEDEGPPLADLSLAIQDGYGDRGPLDPAKQVGRGGIGAGLGAVIRLTDTFEYLATPRKAFRAIRYVARVPRSP